MVFDLPAQQRRTRVAPPLGDPERLVSLIHHF